MNPDLTGNATPTAAGTDGQERGNGFWDKVKGMSPDTSNLYLEPLDPRSGLSSVGDRASLVLQSARPWGEFLNCRAFNLPPLGEVKGRVGHNMETYFYNYFLLACVHVLFFAVGHFWSFLSLVLWISLACYLLVIRSEDFEVGDYSVDKKKKICCLVLAGLLAVFVGHALTLIISLGVFLLVVVGIHSVVRDDTLDAVEPNL